MKKSKQNNLNVFQLMSRFPQLQRMMTEAGMETTSIRKENGHIDTKRAESEQARED